MDSPNTAMFRAIQTAGGVGHLAKALEVSDAAIGQWRDGKRPIPTDRCAQIERVTQGAVRCEDLRPDVVWTRINGRVLIDVTAN